ncbi:MAG: proton-conducting transporter membrane subunit [Clostridiaceae bacterium]
MTSYFSNLPVIAIMAPFLGAFISAIIGNRKKLINLVRAISLVTTFTSVFAIFSLIKPVMMDHKIVSYWMGNWAPENNWAIGIGLEVDAFSLFVAIIISFACFLSVIYSFRYMERDNGLDKYYVLFQLLSGSMIGFVLTGDLFNMYVMLEIMTFAAISLTAFRNHIYKSVEAGFKYLVIGSLGSSLILLGTVLLYSQLHTLNMAQMAALLHGNYTVVSTFALALMLTGYAVKAFLVPCHTWPPDAHMAAPSSISMILSGIMSKTGIYGMVRITYMIYQGAGNNNLEFLLIFWGSITMLVGISMAVIQTDFKRLLAFSSVSQLGYIITAFGVGLASNTEVAVLGTMGGLFHMLNHATFKPLLFLCAGAVLHQAGTTDLNKLGGLAKKMPQTTALFIIGTLAISGIPPFNGFVSKWLIYQATYEAGYAPVTVIALLTSVLTLASLVKVIHSVFFGQLNEEHKDVKEAPLSMRIPMIVLAIIALVVGIIPNVISKYLIEPAAYAVYNIGDYLDVMFTKGYASEMFKEVVPIPKMDYILAGYWDPISWLVLFVILLIGLIIFFAFGYKPKKSAPVDLLDTKYESFTGGEKQDYSHLGGNDMFWGMKQDFGKYFNFLKTAHSGVVNDYVLWVVVCVAFVTIYLFTFM